MRLRQALLVLGLCGLMHALSTASSGQSAQGQNLDQFTPSLNQSTDEQPGFLAAGEANTSGMNTLRASAVVAAPIELSVKDRTYDAAYRDTYSILSADNLCSRFFGGNYAAVEVFNSLAGRMEKGRLENKAGVTMSGETVSVINNRTGLAYRLFKKAVVNNNGPFYRQKMIAPDAPLPRIGSFRPNTREARVLILLHELAHLMKGPDGKWLIPDDGDDRDQSVKNTQVVESQCGDEIKELRSSNNAAHSKLFARREPESATASQGTGPAPQQ